MKNICILLVTVLLSHFQVVAQSNIPQLKKQLSFSAVDSCQVLYELGKQYEEVNLDSCFYFLKESLAIAHRQNNKQAVAQNMFRIGYTYIHFVRNDAKAIEWLNKAIGVAKTTNDNLNLARSYHYLGLIADYQNANNVDELLAKAITYSEASKDWEVLADTYDTLSSYHLKHKRLKKAEEVMFKMMTISEKHSPDDWLSYGLDYADVLESQGKKEAAFAVSQKLDGVRDKLTHSKGEFVYMNDIARLETRLRHYEKADSIFQHLLDIEKAKAKPDTFHLINTLRYVLTLYIAEGSPEKAYQVVKDIIDLNTAVKLNRVNQDSKVKMVEVKSAFELEQKEAEIKLLDEQKTRQQYALIGIILIVIMLVAFMVILHRNKRFIERQKEELTSLNATKDRLFAILSHDLMSPVATLKNYMMLMDWGVMDRAEFAAARQDLKTDVNNLHAMLENVLHWAITQMQGIKPKKEKVIVAEVLNEQVALVAPLAKEKGIGIEQTIPSDVVITMDKNHLALIIRNLLQNALKFTDKGGKISFSSQNTEGGKTTLTITDNGIGIPQETMDKLFKVEQNAHREGTAKEGGTGLGLILTKELVKLNKGRMDLTSEVGKGTTFILGF